MNIFILDEDPIKAAGMLCNKHIAKMTLETAQILCAVSWRYGVPAPYKLTHKNHPCTLWAGESFSNWDWMVKHGLALGEEYSSRVMQGMGLPLDKNNNFVPVHKTHKSVEVIRWNLEQGGKPPAGELTPFVQAMPEIYRSNDAVVAYRHYYLGEKKRMAVWEPYARVPDWFQNHER